MRPAGAGGEVERGLTVRERAHHTRHIAGTAWFDQQRFGRYLTDIVDFGL